MIDMKLDTFAGGALKERFDRELTAVIENIKDINTDHKPARKITIEISIKPNEDRNILATSWKIKKTLAATKAQVTNILAKGRGKNLQLEEFKQLDINEAIEGQRKIVNIEEGRA